MNKVFYLFSLVFFLLFQNFAFGQNCNAGTESAFINCADNNSSGSINVANNSNFTVNTAVDLSNQEINLGNADIELHSDTQIDVNTTFSGNGSAFFVVNGITFSKNTSPTFTELNNMIGSGNYSTLGQITGALPVVLIDFKVLVHY